MVNLKVEYCRCQNDLNKLLEQFDLQGQGTLPALQKVTYLAGPVSGEIYAIVEYVDGELAPVEESAVVADQPEVVSETTAE